MGDDGLEERISFGQELLKAQARIFTEKFGDVDSQWKRDGSRVTEADFAISNGMEGALKERFPGDHYLSEEMDPDNGSVLVESRFAWLADPIDGTNNFARGIPSSSISLVLLENGCPVYGLIYDHMSRSVIHGGHGRGCGVLRGLFGLWLHPGRLLLLLLLLLLMLLLLLLWRLHPRRKRLLLSRSLNWRSNSNSRLMRGNGLRRNRSRGRRRGRRRPRGTERSSLE